MDTEKIQKTLDILTELYDRASENRETDNFQLSIYCKVAALELCGWLEETYDGLIIKHLREHVSDQVEIDKFNERYIKSINGLSYSEHLRILLINLFGFINVIRIEKEIPSLESLSAILGTLHKYRNYLAHNQYLEYLEPNPINRQQGIDTPSKIREKYRKVKPILECLEELIQKINYSPMV